jgi:hypothetical protein
MEFDYWIFRVGIGFVAIAILIGPLLLGLGRTEEEAIEDLSKKLERIDSKLGSRKDTN